MRDRLNRYAIITLAVLGAVSLPLLDCLTGCRAPTPADPHPARDAVADVLRQLLGTAVEVACAPEVAAELRPGEDRPVARVMFDAARARLCKAVTP